MLGRLWSAFRRDNLINWRNGFVAVTIVIALIYVAMVRWLIPADTNLKPAVYFVDKSEGERFAAYVAAEEQAAAVEGFAGLAEMRRAMAENENSVGLVLEGGEAGRALPETTLYFQQHHNARVRNLMAVSTEAELRSLFELPATGEAAVRELVLRGQGEEVKVPFNEMWVPILLFTDTALIGMIFIAALLFMEKEEGTLRAFLVTPGQPWEYLLSKALALALLAGLFTLIFVPATIGAGPNYLYLLLLMVAGSLFGSLLGAWVAVYFDNLSQYLFPALTLMVALSVPSVAYFAPSFSPWWLRLLPTYPLVFGLREALFPSGSPEIVLTALGTLLGLSMVLLGIGSRVFKRQLVQG